MKITINFEAILAWAVTIGYPALKILSSWYITKREFQYPTWDRDGVQVKRRLHHLITAYIRNFTINPEWAATKLIAFAPVWLLSGWRFWDTFSPWRIKKAPAFCKTCNDRGQYYVKGFLRGVKATWHECEECQAAQTRCTIHFCKVCLDTHSIGPSRPCPHCERRGREAKERLEHPMYHTSAHLTDKDDQPSFREAYLNEPPWKLAEEAALSAAEAVETAGKFARRTTREARVREAANKAAEVLKSKCKDFEVANRVEVNPYFVMAQQLAREKGGILPSDLWLQRNGYLVLLSFMKKHPGFRKSVESSREPVAVQPVAVQHPNCDCHYCKIGRGSG